MEKQKKRKESESYIEPQPTSSAEELDSTPKMEKLYKLISQKLNLFDRSKGDVESSTQRILSNQSLDGVAEYIKSGKCKNIIVMAGAGISTSAGIPDFRSPSSGLYHNLEKYNLPYPQAIFEIDFFNKNPEPFFILAKELMPEGFKPTHSHYFVRLLWKKGLLLRHYTQNIDTLERLAGIPSEKLVEAHGTFNSGHCCKCGAPYGFSWMKTKIKGETIPKCEKCHEGVVKPDIIFFGEMLPDRFRYLIDLDFPRADLLIIMGSSLVVQPFASLINRVKPNVPRLLINREEVGKVITLSKLLGSRRGSNFDSKSGRDVAWLGECDRGCQELADKLGWTEELEALLKKEHSILEDTTNNE